MIAVVCFDSPIAIAMTSIISTVVGFFVNAYPNKNLINYTYFEQLRDVLPYILTSLVMLVVVSMVRLLKYNALTTLLLQIVIGIVVYFLVSAVFRVKAFSMTIDAIKKLRKKKEEN